MENFLELIKDNKIGETIHFVIMQDNFPVSPGHLLVISKKLKCDYFDLTNDELLNLATAIKVAKRLIEEHYKPDGYNIGMNCGKAAGQSVMHFHCHVIPRYDGDTENPRGGVRHCIPGKGNY